jgi:DNA-binding MarR family transcriptional regulator
MKSEKGLRHRRTIGPEPVTEPLPQTIDPESFTPRLLALLSNALVWRESHQLRHRFALGTNEWRVISALALRPGSSATEVCDFLGMNKAIVSRSANILGERGLIALDDGPRGSRPMFLTRAGATMHDAMLPISLEGQDIILADLTREEIVLLNNLLQRMLKRTQDLESA